MLAINQVLTTAKILIFTIIKIGMLVLQKFVYIYCCIFMIKETLFETIS